MLLSIQFVRAINYQLDIFFQESDKEVETAEEQTAQVKAMPDTHPHKKRALPAARPGAAKCLDVNSNANFFIRWRVCRRGNNF